MLYESGARDLTCRSRAPATSLGHYLSVRRCLGMGVGSQKCRLCKSATASSSDSEGRVSIRFAVRKCHFVKIASGQLLETGRAAGYSSTAPSLLLFVARSDPDHTAFPADSVCASAPLIGSLRLGETRYLVRERTRNSDAWDQSGMLRCKCFPKGPGVQGCSGAAWEVAGS